MNHGTVKSMTYSGMLFFLKAVCYLSLLKFILLQYFGGDHDLWVLCNSLFSQTAAPEARNILPASHPRLNLSPIRKASFPPSGQVQGPQAARWLPSFSLRVN